MKVDVVRIDRGARQNLADEVTDEVPLTIYLGDRELVTLLCSPASLKELAVGFLYSAGVVSSADDIENIVIDKSRWAASVSLKDKDAPAELIFKRLYSSGCGKGVLFYNALDLMHRKVLASDATISADKISELMRSFERKSESFKKTGGVHSAAFSDGKSILIFNDDIGRHNALDKIIGEALMKKLNMQDLIVLTSGRISIDVMFKVQKIGAPFVISRSAPTDQAVKLASASNITLVGFARGRRMNVYSGEQRIL